eukprot:scpid77451/ scgid31157/ 
MASQHPVFTEQDIARSLQELGHGAVSDDRLQRLTQAVQQLAMAGSGGHPASARHDDGNEEDDDHSPWPSEGSVNRLVPETAAAAAGPAAAGPAAARPAATTARPAAARPSATATARPAVPVGTAHQYGSRAFHAHPGADAQHIHGDAHGGVSALNGSASGTYAREQTGQDTRGLTNSVPGRSTAFAPTQYRPNVGGDGVAACSGGDVSDCPSGVSSSTFSIVTSGIPDSIGDNDDAERVVGGGGMRARGANSNAEGKTRVGATVAPRHDGKASMGSALPPSTSHSALMDEVGIATHAPDRDERMPTQPVRSRAERDGSNNTRAALSAVTYAKQALPRSLANGHVARDASPRHVCPQATTNPSTAAGRPRDKSDVLERSADKLSARLRQLEVQAAKLEAAAARD